MIPNLTLAKLATALKAAADHIRTKGHYKGELYADSGSSDVTQYGACAYGATAIGLTQVGIDVLNAPSPMFQDARLSGVLLEAIHDLYPTDAAASKLDMEGSNGHDVPDWVITFNDRLSTTPEQVADLLDHAAKIAHTRQET